MTDQYITEFGLSEEYEELLEVKKALTIDKINFALTGDRKLLTMIRINELKIVQLTAEKVASDDYGMIATVEKILNRTIDEKTCSTMKFYKYVEMIKLEGERNLIKNNDG